jgi:Flp pilus assembly protein TadD
LRGPIATREIATRGKQGERQRELGDVVPSARSTELAHSSAQTRHARISGSCWRRDRRSSFCDSVGTVQRGESGGRGEAVADAARTWPHPFAHVHASGGVIITVLLAGIGDGARGVARLVETRRRCARITEPGVLPLQAVEVEAGSGRIALRTPDFAGITVAELLERGPLVATRMIAILRAVARAIAAAHRETLLHRALGPASVLVGERDEVRVLDFGIGELLGKSSPSSSLQLQPFTPERVLGLPRGVAEDVYLLGCLGYFLATGEPALVDDDVDRLRRRHAIEDPPRLAQQGAGRVPLRLARAIDRCLAKDAEDRFADVDELLVEIDAAALELAAVERCASPPRRPIAPPVVAPVARPSVVRPIAAPSIVRPIASTPVDAAPLVIAPPPVVAVPSVAATPLVIAVPPVVAAAPVMRPEPVATPPASAAVIAVEPAIVVAGPITSSVVAEPPAAALDAVGPRGGSALGGARARRPGVRSIAAVVALFSIVALALALARPSTADRGPAIVAASDAPAVADRGVHPPASLAAEAETPTFAPPTTPPVDVPRRGAAASDDALAVAPPSDAPDTADADPEVVVEASSTAPEVTALLATAKAARQQGRRADAMTAYKKVAVIDPDNAEALGALARISFDRADFGDAVQWGRRAVAASPRSGKARIALGDAYYKLGKLAEAEAQYRRASTLGHRLAERRLAMLASP